MNSKLRQIVYECLLEAITNKIVDENRVVTFGGQTYPKFGYCIFLAGNGGSGKGYVWRNLMPIDGKVINVDDFKKMYVDMHNGKININGKEETYDPHNPEHVKNVHYAVRDKGWKQKTIDNSFNNETHISSRLPNIIFDMVGKNPDEIMDLCMDAQELGYNTMLVWVITTRHQALLRNLSRDRQIPDSVLHNAANELSDNMPRFLKSPLSVEYLDDAWLVFNSTETLDGNDLQGDDVKTAAVHLKATNGGFKMDNETEQRLNRYLGKNEINPDNPQTYMTSKEIADKYGKPKYKMNKSNGKEEFDGYSFDRNQFDKTSTLYRD